jgi:hypothetical protein
VALRCDLHKLTVLASSKVRGVAESLVMTKDDLEIEGIKGGEAIQERWIENQVKLRARLLLEVGLYIHEGQ